MQQFRQLVTELQTADSALRICMVGRKKREVERRRKELRISELDRGTDLERCDADLLRCELEEMRIGEAQEERALAGKLREVQTICHLLQTEYKDWLTLSEEEQLQHEVEYWVQRLARQASNDLASMGRIGPDNINTIRSLPDAERHEILRLVCLEDLQHNQELPRIRDQALSVLSDEKEFDNQLPYTVPAAEPAFLPLKLRAQAPPGYPRDKIVDASRIDFVVGVLHRDMERDRPVRERFQFPVGKNHTMIRDECPSGAMIGEYKYRLALHAESLGATHLFILDDDVDPPENTILRLYGHDLDVVGGWYPRKVDPPDSASMILVDGAPEPVPDGPGLIEVDWALTAGCTLYRMGALLRLPRPWFRTTGKCTEDTYFTCMAREHGVRSWLDRDLKVGHIDKNTGRRYEIVQ